MDLELMNPALPVTFRVHKGIAIDFAIHAHGQLEINISIIRQHHGCGVFAGETGLPDAALDFTKGIFQADSAFQHLGIGAILHAGSTIILAIQQYIIGAADANSRRDRIHAVGLATATLAYQPRNRTQAAF